MRRVVTLCIGHAPALILAPTGTALGKRRLFSRFLAMLITDLRHALA